MVRLHLGRCLSLLLLATAAPGHAEPRGSELKPGQSLRGATGDLLTASASFETTFVMQKDCNLVVYHGTRAAWASNTSGKGGNCRLDMQGDGNLVVYRGGDNKAMWASNTADRPGAHLIAQRDGNVVLYQGTKPIWATNTVVKVSRPSGGIGRGNQQPVPGKFQGCAFSRTETKCIVAVQLCKSVYACGYNAGSATPIEKDDGWGACGACFGLDF